MQSQVLKGWSLNDTHYDNVTTLLYQNCKRNITGEGGSYFPLGVGGGESDADVAYEKYECDYLFANWGIRDLWIGIFTSMTVSSILRNHGLKCILAIK